jgi:hypothetical protein
MSNETLKPQEQPAQSPLQSGGHFEALRQSQISDLAAERRRWLESIKPEVSLKRYYQIEEKIKAEEKSLTEILDWQEGRSTQLSKYSLILDPHYFEQEFLN